MSFLIKTGCAACVALGVVSAFAQSTSRDAGLDPVVVSGARIEQRLSDTLPTTQVITRDEIERSQAPDALTLLRRLAGVEVVQTGGLGAQSTLFLRGGSGRSALVLVDGVPINNVNFGTASIEQLAATQIERIEVVTGSIGALYGAQASGGVVQLFTRNGEGADVSVGGGSRATRRAQASFAGASGPLKFGVQLAGDETRGFNATVQSERPGTNPDADGDRNASVAAHVSAALDGGHEVGARYTRTRGRVDYDSEFGPPTQTDRSVDVIETATGYGRFKLLDRWTARLSASRSADKLDAIETAFPYFVHSATQQLAWDNEVAIADGWTGTAGLERLTQRIQSDTTYAVDERTVNSVRAGLNGRVGPHTVQANARTDSTSDFGRHTTWFAGYGFDVAPGWRVSASAATAFNAPSFNDLYFPFGGNPALKPETSRTLEGALQYTRDAVFARASVFRTRYRDLIGFDDAFNTINIGRAKITGLELVGGFNLADWRVQASATAQDAKDDVTGTRLTRRARLFGNATVSRTLGTAEIEANWHASGNRSDRDAFGQNVALAGYGTLDLAARWHVLPQWTLGLRIENALDRRYETVYGYHTIPFGVFATLDYRLR